MATQMDLADKTELDQIVSFNNTKTTWNIIERLSPYPKNADSYTPQSDSFCHSYVFRVELAGTSEKIVPEHIPKFAIMKMKSRYSILSANVPKDTIEVGLLNEIRALEQLMMNGSLHAPRLLDVKVEHHLTSLRNYNPPKENQAERQHYVTYILMSEVIGHCLKGGAFWKLEQNERQSIRMAFRTALTDIHRNWVVLTKPDPKHLIWCRQTQTISIVNFENSITFNNLGKMRDEEENISRSLPVRFQKWQNKWYYDWGLSKDGVSGIFSKGTDGTTFEDDGSDWTARYTEAMLQEPKTPEENCAKLLVGALGEKIEENEERKAYMTQLEKFHKMQKLSVCAVM